MILFDSTFILINGPIWKIWRLHRQSKVVFGQWQIRNSMERVSHSKSRGVRLSLSSSNKGISLRSTKYTVNQYSTNPKPSKHHSLYRLSHQWEQSLYGDVALRRRNSLRFTHEFPHWWGFNFSSTLLLLTNCERDSLYVWKKYPA